METENNNSLGEANEKQKSGKKKALILIIVSVVLLGGIYGYFTYFYSSHFYHNTYINDIKIGDFTLSQADAAVKASEGDYSLRIIYRGPEDGTLQDFTISGNAIDLARKYEKELPELLNSQKPYLWIKGIGKKSSVSANFVNLYDEDKLDGILLNETFMQKNHMIFPKDAYIDFKDSHYFIEPEVSGNRLDPDKVRELVKKSITDNESIIDLTILDLYERPQIYKEDEALKDRLEELGTTLSAVITYTFGDTTEIVDANVYEDWIIKDGDDFHIDEKKAEKYVEELAARRDTYGQPGYFTTIDGYIVKLSKDKYGWQIDKEKETKRLVDEITHKHKIKRNPEYIHEAKGFGNGDVGDYYVEVNMTDQVAYLIDNGVIMWKSDCVTGHASLDRGTPTGIYSVYFKQKNRTLHGEDYESFVYYWIAFNNHIGLHDATWRAKFGGTIYKRNGSHGCVNLPKKRVAELYDMVEVGTPVICYYLNDNYVVSRPQHTVSYNSMVVEDSE